jgi:dTDP-4-amino-4,6-dideoxygalactose transaminase
VTASPQVSTDGEVTELIPVARPLLGPEEARAAAEVIASGWVAQGPHVARFEEAFAAQVQGRHAVAVSSCTAALHLAMLVAGIGPGDEVVVPSLSFVATANSVRYVGARPVFADVDQDSLALTAETIEPLLTPKTRAVLLVHQAGTPADIDDVQALCERHGLELFEDAACAVGATYHSRPIGGHTRMAAFSFHPRKLITTGEGGMLVCRDAEDADRARRLREHAMDISAADRHRAHGVVIERYLETGFNYRMTDIQAAIGLVQLSRLADILRRRRELGRRYDDWLTEMTGLRVPRRPAWGLPNFQSYWVELTPDWPTTRDQLLSLMLEHGVSLRRGIMAAHREPAYVEEGSAPLPVTDRITDRSVILPLFHQMTNEQQRHVVTVLGEIAGR